jgi:ribonuclease P protein component
MLPKNNRLNIRTYFGEIRGSGKKLSGPYFSFYYRTSEDTAIPQINIIVSKKVAKSAVKRNRMRRLINTVMRKSLPKVPNSLQGLFFVYKDYSKLSSNELQALIHLMFESAGLTKKEV